MTDPHVAGVVAALRDAGCVFADDEARLLVEAAQTARELDELVARRVAGTPLEHVLGWAEFAGLRVAVAPDVFVPRRRTELVVRAAARVVTAGSVVVDLCCGSGAVGVALATAVAGLRLHAVDVDAAAVACARRNVEPLGGRVHHGDLYDALPATLRRRIDVVVANAPYVPSDEVALMPVDARAHEPLVALDGGGDGLDVVRRIVAGAAEWLKPHGHVVVETSEPQVDDVLTECAARGFDARAVRASELDAVAVVAVLPFTD